VPHTALARAQPARIFQGLSQKVELVVVASCCISDASHILRSGAGLPSAAARAVALGGAEALLLRALMGRRADAIAAAAGAVAGAEQRAAREAADACGAQVVLGARAQQPVPHQLSGS
jgi:hypothetical protein